MLIRKANDSVINMKYDRFLRSAIASEGEFISTKEIIKWVSKRCDEVRVNIERINLSDMTDWYLDKSEGRIRHRTGKFFSIDGISVETNVGSVPIWDQPIINQPEIGFLGCIVKDFNGILYFLVQAKIEPGNINTVQLSPTLQATKSNYTQTHKGKAPKFLEYFLDNKKSVKLMDQLQSEQGARFLNKRNRNIIIEIFDEVPFDEDYRWMTLGQIKQLSEIDNLVNMDLRTVVAGIPFDRCSPLSMDIWESMIEYSDKKKLSMLVSAVDNSNSQIEFDEIIGWLTERKIETDLNITKKPLQNLNQWKVEENGIYHSENLYFDVRWVKVEIENREVSSWEQPLVAPVESGIIAFIIKKINGIYHFLVQAKMECGNFDLLELAPTVQCITGSYKNSLDKVPFLKYVLHALPEQIWHDSLQSEEGGRFYREENRNMIIEAGLDFPSDIPNNFQWLTLNQMLQFIRFNNYLNIQARGLLSTIRFV